MKLSLTNCSTFLFRQLKSSGNYMLELSSTTRIKVFNGIGNNIDPFHKSSRHIHSHFTAHLHNTAVLPKQIQGSR